MDANRLASVITEVVTEFFQGKLPLQSHIPVGVSNRHLHLGKADMEVLFGHNKLTHYKELGQPGQYAAQETVTIVGASGVIEKVRVLGPLRDKTQVEISVSDAIKLGIAPPVRDSGILDGSAGATLVGPKGSVTLRDGVILAARHIHMHTEDAFRFGLSDGAVVKVQTGGSRGLTYENVVVRVNPQYSLEFHVDIDEANAAGLKTGDEVKIIA